MRKMLLLLAALLLIMISPTLLLFGPQGRAFAQALSRDGKAHVVVGNTDIYNHPDITVLELTELQKARLDAARQKVWRWQDKMQEALEEFGAVCLEAQKENHWPAVQCGLNDLGITPQLPAASGQAPAKPPTPPATKTPEEK